MERKLTPTIWSRLVSRDEDNTCSRNDSCGRPMSANATTLAIVLGIIIPVILAVIVLIYLHRRHVRKVRLEDAKDADMNLDFGLGDAALNKKGKRMSMFGISEKQIHRPGQLSMDMNLSSPYLLPPAMTQSHESIHSMARSFHNEQDPYHTVPLYSGGDGASVRSSVRGNSSNGNSGKNSRRQSIITSGPMMRPPRTQSRPRSPVSAGGQSDPFATPIAPEPVHKLPEAAQVSDLKLPVQPIVPEIGTVYPDELSSHHGLDTPDIQHPPLVLSKESHGTYNNQAEEYNKFELPELPTDNSIGAAHSDNELPQIPTLVQGRESPDLGFNLDLPTIVPSSANHDETYHYDGANYDAHGDHSSHPQIQTSEYFDDMQQAHYNDDHAMGYNAQQDGLHIPQVDNKRLSVGFRPLPPDEVMESEDPEFRANRIRSFYKEYFDDSSNAPPLPTQTYHEDYDANYLGDAAYYDVDTNRFVMPYAQPVTRRAMTPPPSGRRGGPPMGGPRGPRGPRGPGSVGGMSMPGGRGRPRAGSAFGPRPGSSASAARRGPKKNLPPPQPLNTLPTPSKLRDDSAIFNATDFAPPDNFRDQAAGRSQSPFGERRAYNPTLPAATPIVSSFDELAALPSAHSLRKSSTFTNLDFAPPKKFKDVDTMSDAGSIRSNRSGLSARNLGALRAGAGRVSRLPGDTVFTAAALQDQLKPSWSLRA